MEQEKMFELASFLKELRDEKGDLEEKIKGLNVEIESIQSELIEALVNQESTGFNHQGFNFSLVVKEYPGPEPERKDELWAVMKEQGFEHWGVSVGGCRHWGLCAAGAYRHTQRKCGRRVGLFKGKSV